MRFSCNRFRWSLASLFLFICVCAFYMNIEESVEYSDSRPQGDASGIVLDVGYPEGGFAEEFSSSLRDGESVRLFVSAQGVSPQHAMDNVLKYRKSARNISDPGSEYIKYRVVGGATVDYYYFSGLSVFVSCIVDSDVDVLGNPMCRANFGQVFPDVFVSAVFSAKLVSEMKDISAFVRDFIGSHISKKASS